MKNIESLIAPTTVTIKDAWKRINLNSSRILFIIDTAKQIVGTISDGDIRRWVLADKSLNENVLAATNTNPIIADDSTPRESIRKLLLEKSIGCVPIVNAEREICDVVFATDFLDAPQDSPRKESMPQIPVVIMAGGSGTRLNPFTKILPKALIPIGEKPIIEVIIERFREYAVKDFYISVNYKAAMIKAYFFENHDAYNLEFFEETKPLGTAGSLYLLKDKLNSTFFVSNCDILIDANYKDILDFHTKNSADITIVCSMIHSKLPYGVVQISTGGELKSIVEKPEIDSLVNTGMYLINYAMLDLIPENDFFNMTSLIETVQKRGGRVLVYPVSEKSWVDIGQLEEYQSTLRKLEGMQ